MKETKIISKINQTVAGALAEQIVSDLHAMKRKSRQDMESKVLKDPMIVKAMSIVRQRAKMRDEIDRIESQIRQKYKLRSISIGDRSVSVNSYEDNGVAAVSVVKSDIIIANHVDGIPYHEMKAHILKTYSDRERKVKE
jgi:hypothetical protein